MAKIGVVIESENSEIKKTNLGVIAAARHSGENEVVALIMDEKVIEGKSALQPYGVNKIVYLANKQGDFSLNPDLQAKALVAIAGELELDGMFGLASATGRDLFARVAAIMQIPLVSDCFGIDFANQTAQKSHFSGKTIATIKVDGKFWLCTIRPNAIEAEEAPGDLLEETVSVQIDSFPSIKIVEEKKGDTGSVDLTEAEVIITGGRPIGSAENYGMLEACARLIGAAVGASRAAVDAGFAPHGMQVGQTGKTVSPRLYIGCGLSGSVQHFAGMKTSKVIVAINSDKDAPIFQKCDYGIVGDMFEVVPMLTEVLKKRL